MAVAPLIFFSLAWNSTVTGFVDFFTFHSFNPIWMSLAIANTCLLTKVCQISKAWSDSPMLKYLAIVEVCLIETSGLSGGEDKGSSKISMHELKQEKLVCLTIRVRWYISIRIATQSEMRTWQQQIILK